MSEVEKFEVTSRSQARRIAAQTGRPAPTHFPQENEGHMCDGTCIPTPPAPPEVQAVAAWPSNALLIRDVASLYLDRKMLTLDMTYGRGKWWTIWRPDNLVTNDLNPDTEAWFHDDFRNLGFEDGLFDLVAFDPPYKLNGTPALGDFDDRYGVSVPTRWQDRMTLIEDGIAEGARVLKGGGLLLLKCQDQVVSGKVRWQTHWFTTTAWCEGLELVDRFDMLGGSRPQPAGRRQVHARNRPSTLLVFKKGGMWE